MVLVLEGVIILAIVSASMYVNNPYAQERAARLVRRILRPRGAEGEAAAGSAAGEGQQP